MIEEPNKDESIKLESEHIFDSDLSDRQVTNPGFLPGVDDPMVAAYGNFLSEMKDMMRPPMAVGFAPLKREHKVRIWKFDDSMIRGEICAEIEALLNDGYQCQSPAVICGQYVMLDFSRPKEGEEHAPHAPTD